MPAPRHIARELATSLALQPWTRDAIAHHLATRLPTKHAGLATPVATDLRTAFPHPFTPRPALLTAALRSNPLLAPVWHEASRLGLRPAPTLDTPQFHPTPAFATLDLPPLATPDDLATHLGLTPAQLIRFSDLRGLSNAQADPFAPHYRFHLIPKPTGGTRLIEEPKPLLKRLQRRLLRTLLDPVPPHPAAHGFTRGRSCAQAAATHAGEAMVVRFDLAHYFTTITGNRLHGLFRCMGYPHAVARHLAGLVTLSTPPHIRERLPAQDRATAAMRHLPQGAPTSPALANLATYRLDRRLAGLARRIDARYTRYADDLTFSGDAHIAPILARAVPQITAEEGFHLNPAKTRLQPAHTRQTVTGIVVNSHLNTPREAYDLLKATLHRAPSDPETLSRLDGQIAWLESLNPHKGAKLRARWLALAHPAP